MATITGDGQTTEMDAWVGCVDASVECGIFTACYDGTLKLSGIASAFILLSSSWSIVYN